MPNEKRPDATTPATAGTVTEPHPHGPGAPVPHPAWRVPILGDLLRLSPSTPTQNEMHLARSLGPIFELKIGPATRVLVLTGADIVAEANDEQRFEKFIAPPHLKMRDIAGDGLFTAFNREPAWAVAHELLQPGFAKQAMLRYHDAMLSSVDSLFEYWDNQPAGELHDVGVDMNALTFEVIGRAGFNQTFGAFDSGDREFITRLNRAMFWMSTSVNAFPVARAVLELKYKRQYERDVAWLNDYAAQLVRARRAGTDTPLDDHTDLLDLMLDATSDSEPALSDTNIANQVMTFLLAGNETTAGAMGFALHYMAENPDAAARVRDEVNSVLTGDAPTFADVAKLRFTRKVIDETLRLWPPAPAYFRRSRTDQMIGGKYFIPKGGAVMVLILGLHRTPEWGDNPDQFDPDRFDRLTTRGATHPYRPFGTGPRACIGRQFALHEMVLALAMIVRRYDLHSEPGYKLSVSEQLTLKPADLRLKMEKTP